MAARPRTLPAAIAPVLVGTAAAVEVSSEIRVGAFLAALVGSVFIQIGTNLANDYSDAKRGADTADRLGPVRVTSSGLVAPRRVLVATWVAFGVAVAAGIYLATIAGPVIPSSAALKLAFKSLSASGERLDISRHQATVSRSSLPTGTTAFASPMSCASAAS